MKRHDLIVASVAALLTGVIALAQSPALGEVRVPSWDSVGEASGLWQTHLNFTNSFTPMWFDLDGDDVPEPLWWSFLGSVYLDVTTGEPEITELDLPEKLKQIDNLPLLAVALDSDGDGDKEVLVVGRELVLLNHVGGAKFTVATSNLPSLPGAQINDVAVGDLNHDGLPDVVLALGLAIFDRADPVGLPDMVLMNRGMGRFERYPIEPSREAYTRGLTLADMDRDGRLDLVESVAAAVAGPGRILLNRTEPGGSVPVFEVSEHVWDTSPFGMGAAVGDLDGDDHLDIYNTSIGRDLLTYGSPDGSYEPQTAALGITHEWGPEALRVQWCPSFLDLNGDGRLDILVRHGGKDQLESGSLTELATQASDLSYLQDSDGRFHRAAVPYDSVAGGQGRHAVGGDWNGDGLPEIALGGLDGASDFWRNETALPPTTRALTVRLRTTVSAWPPTGAVVTGRCDDASWTRHLTSGGHLGASAAVEVYGAWEGCSGAPEIEVRWPSGARSTHQPQSGVTTMTVVEPAWWSREDLTVTLDASIAGASKACIGGSATDWSCCEAMSGPCEFTLANLDVATSASLDDAAPVLITAEVDWGMHMWPSPPRPGEPAYLNIMHVGDPSTFAPEATSVWINGETVVVDPQAIDYDRRTVQYKWEVPLATPALYITLSPLNLLPEVTWTLPTGYSMDPDWLHIATYPNIIFDGETQSWHVAVLVNLLREPTMEEQISYLTLNTADGLPVPILKQYLKSSVARVRLLVDPLLLGDVPELRIQDLGAGHSSTFILPKPTSLETAVSRLKRVDGNLYRPSMHGAGDLSPLFITLRDEADRVLPPERSLVSLEVDGAHMSEPLSIYESTYNLTALANSDSQLGPGEVRVLGLDGTLLGSFPFERSAPPEIELDLSATTADLLKTSVESPENTTHRVVIRPRMSNGELAGAAGRAELNVTGAEIMVPLSLDRAGALTAHLRVDPTATELEVQVILDGTELTTLSAALEPTAAPEPDTVDENPENEAPPQSSSRDDGCRAGGPVPLLWWLASLTLGLAWRRPARCS